MSDPYSGITMREDTVPNIETILLSITVFTIRSSLRIWSQIVRVLGTILPAVYCGDFGKIGPESGFYPKSPQVWGCSGSAKINGAVECFHLVARTKFKYELSKLNFRNFIFVRQTTILARDLKFENCFHFGFCPRRGVWILRSGGWVTLTLPYFFNFFYL